nr:hypothetical protein [Moraxella sp. CTOTU46711]
MFEKLKDEFWTFCEITDRKSSILYGPMAFLVLVMVIGTILINMARNLSETKAASSFDLLANFVATYTELTGLGIMVFGFIGYFVLTSHLYTKEKRRLERLY